MTPKDIIIIGAGAAGLMCAAVAARRYQHVLTLDQANKPGKKILMSGGGRCNFTNLHTSHENFISNNPHFCRSALSRYTPQHFIDLVERYQIPYHEKTLGQLFCDRKSKDILDMLLAECVENQVQHEYQVAIQNIRKESSGRFLIETNQGDFSSDVLVIATGGLSIPSMGSSPFGYKVAEQFNLNVCPTRAGLVPFTLHEADKEKFETLPGIASDCTVTFKKTTFKEAMLFTHRGLSGPAMLQISSYWQPGNELKICLNPAIDLECILREAQAPTRTLKNALTPYFPKRLVESFFSEEALNQPLQNYSHKKLKMIADAIQDWRIKPNGTEGYRTAEVTLGGVDCNELSSKTLEVKSVSGLYFIGEVLDVTGWLGGYNFQWAWASAVAAGSAL